MLPWVIMIIFLLFSPDLFHIWSIYYSTSPSILLFCTMLQYRFEHTVPWGKLNKYNSLHYSVYLYSLCGFLVDHFGFFRDAKKNGPCKWIGLCIHSKPPVDLHVVLLLFKCVSFVLFFPFLCFALFFFIIFFFFVLFFFV